MLKFFTPMYCPISRCFRGEGGERAFAPASYFHNIQNIGKGDVEVIAFFSHAEPDYVGIGEVIGSYSNEVLA